MTWAPEDSEIVGEDTAVAAIKALGAATSPIQL